MRKERHTPGPWSVVPGDDAERREDEYGNILSPSDIESVDALTVVCTMAGGIPTEEHDANAQRIVACVNACAGIKDPRAIRDAIKALGECRSALALCVPYVPTDGDAERDAIEAASDAVVHARAALDNLGAV